MDEAALVCLFGVLSIMALGMLALSSGPTKMIKYEPSVKVIKIVDVVEKPNVHQQHLGVIKDDEAKKPDVHQRFLDIVKDDKDFEIYFQTEN